MEKQCLPDRDQLHRFKHDGFVKIEECISPEAAHYLREAITAEVQQFNAGNRKEDPRYIFARTNHILEISNLFNILQEFSDLKLHARLARIAAVLMDVIAIRVYHDALLYKTNAHPSVPWHQDDYFSVLDRKGITAWMPLVPVEKANGSLIYACGSDQEGLLDRDAMAGDDQVHQYLVEQGYEFCCPSMQPGDVLFHNSYVFHRSERNETDAPRIAFSVFFFEDGCRIREPIFGKRDIVDMIYFPDLGIGDLADTMLNPLVYSC